MISVEVVLFDLGNTLLYDRPRAWPRVYARAEAALWRVLRREGVQIDPAQLYGGPETFLGYYYGLRGQGAVEPGALRVLARLLQDHDQAIDEGAAERSLRAMYAVTQTNWRVEGDAVSTLRGLLKTGFRLGAVSNGSDERNAFELLERTRMQNCFEVVITSAAHGRRKPDPSIFQAALAHFRVPPHRAVMIGDSYQADILGASGLGMASIWITRRAERPQGPLTVTPDATVRTLREIPGRLALA